MKKFIPWIVCFIIAIHTIIPPLELSINFTNSPMRFVWTFLFFGIMAFYFIFTRANIWFKILLPYLFINTFLSRAPHLSMTTFIWIALGAYFYLLCLEITDWKPVFNTLACILMLEVLLFSLKAYHKETLLNFGKQATECFGTVGNLMQFKSLIVILLALLIQSIKPRKIRVIYAYCTGALFFILYFFTHNTWINFLYARAPVWLATIKLSLQHPIVGYGLGTYEKLFNILAHGHFELEGVWANAHNEFLHFLFEAGSIGFFILVAYSISLLAKCRGLALLGVLMIGFSFSVHFPAHQNSTCLLLALAAAYFDQRIKEKRLCQPLPA